jgi:hypothetical protein
MRLFTLVLSILFLSAVSLNSAGAQTSLDLPLSGGFYGLDNQSLSGGTKTYTISLLENASYLFVGVLAREGVVNLEVKNSGNGVFLGSGGSVVVENARQGTYTVTISGNGKYLVFWDYLRKESCIPASCSSLGKQCGHWPDGCGGNLDCGTCIPECSSAGGVCKPNACSTYANCADLSSGQCDSGNCCSGSCTVQGCTLQIPPNAQVLSLDHRYPPGAGGLNFQPGETVFSVLVTADNITRMIGQILGLTGETYVIWTWIMPDCKTFKGNAMGTDNAEMLDIRSLNAVAPNINYNYIPVGNHTFKIKANAPSNVIIWFTAYQ